MLVLSRKEDESIRIGDDVVITIIGISGSSVRFGVQAPPRVEVHREEVYRRIQAEKRAESQSLA